MLRDKKLHIDDVVERFLTTIFPFQNGIREMYLFGSRSRDDWRPDSDYDILVVVDKKDRDIKNRLYDAVMDILLDTGRLISLKIFTTSEFNRLKEIPTPFMSNIIKEGIRLGSHD